ncbi:MAG: hypothetical protein RL885_31590 [Planctomycetota bacterium]
MKARRASIAMAVVLFLFVSGALGAFIGRFLGIALSPFFLRDLETVGPIWGGGLGMLFGVSFLICVAAWRRRSWNGLAVGSLLLAPIVCALGGGAAGHLLGSSWWQGALWSFFWGLYPGFISWTLFAVLATMSEGAKAKEPK